MPFLLFLPKLIWMFAYVRLLYLKSKSTMTDYKMHQHENLQLDWQLTAAAKRDFHSFSSLFLFYIDISFFVSLSPDSSASAASCFSSNLFFRLLSLDLFSLAQLPAPVRSPRLYVAMQRSLAYKFDNIPVLDYYLSTVRGCGVLLQVNVAD